MKRDRRDNIYNFVLYVCVYRGDPQELNVISGVRAPMLDSLFLFVLIFLIT